MCSNRNKKEGIKVTDQEYMLRAIQLAKKGEGWTNPNPMVGAVIVKDGRSSEKVIIKSMENFMQNVMRLLHLPNQQKVRYFMLHWNLAAIMERRLHVRKQFLNKRFKKW